MGPLEFCGKLLSGAQIGADQLVSPDPTLCPAVAEQYLTRSVMFASCYGSQLLPG
jgi:hypothetical protein